MVSLLTDFVKAPIALRLPEGATVLLVPAQSFLAILRSSRQSHAVVINGAVSTVFALVTLFLLFPFLKRPIIVVDLVLRPPRTMRQRMLLPIKRRAFSRVDHFIHYFKDLEGYERYFGIGQRRSSYVPFKVNIWGVSQRSSERGHYVFAAGTSQRDYDTFIEAVAACGCPAMMPEFSFDNVEERAVALTRPKDYLPPNLTLLQDLGSRDELIQSLLGASIVVIPTLKDSICASGISICLDAMFLGKCVIMSRGPGASGILSDEAILVDAGDAQQLRDAIERAWQDDAYREGFAERGHRHAMRLGGERELLERIMTEALFWLESASGGLERATAPRDELS